MFLQIEYTISERTPPDHARVFNQHALSCGSRAGGSFFFCANPTANQIVSVWHHVMRKILYAITIYVTAS